MKTRFYLVLLLLIVFMTGCTQKRVLKVACVGDSITQGAAASDRAEKGYVGQLSLLMGEWYDVRNFGLSGTTVCKNSYLPYDGTEEFVQAQAFEPDIVTIALGTNDSQPRVWNEGDYARNFEGDLISLCEVFEQLPSKPQIFLCLPIPIIPSERWTHQPQVVADEIIPIIKKVAQEKGYGLIDLHTPLLGKIECYPANDLLHPNDLGHRQMAEVIYETLRNVKVKK